MTKYSIHKVYAYIRVYDHIKVTKSPYVEYNDGAIVGDHDFVFTNVNLGKLVDDVKATLGHLYTPTKGK